MTVDSTTAGDTTPSGLGLPWLSDHRKTEFSDHRETDGTAVPGQTSPPVRTDLRLDSPLSAVRSTTGKLRLPDLTLTFADPRTSGVEIHLTAVTAFSLNDGDPAALVAWLERNYLPHPVRRPRRTPGEPDELITGLILPDAVLDPRCLPLMVRIRWSVSWTVAGGRRLAERSQTIVLRD
ncbi:MAG: hypothetical protein QG608_2783 [Actinomycetota bacterium]|nr:hypothetical protein [Actinomycetota bacterium]